MNGLNSNNAPDVNVVKPHFIFAAIALLVLSVMVILADTALLGPYFESKIVAITHMAVLGWAIMIVFGALYQLVPVVFETSLYSEKLAVVTFWLSGFGALFLSYSFWISDYLNLLPLAAIVMFVSLLMFVVNIVLSYKNSKKKNVSSKFVITAVVWLAITELIGTLIALNFKFNFLSETHLHYLKIHASIGLIGWFLMLIIGVGSILIPMFLVSHQLNHKKLEKAYYLINVGLVAISINWFFVQIDIVNPIFWLSIVIGIIFFLSFVYDSYKKRLRKSLDIGMKHTVIAIFSLVLPMIISVIILMGFNLGPSVLLRSTMLYGFTILFGLITNLILGQTYKTLPFVIWLDKYQALVGKAKTPLPRELYSIKIANAQFGFYMLFLVFMIVGWVFDQILWIRIGGYLLLMAAILYNINIFKIIFHKIKIKE